MLVNWSHGKPDDKTKKALLAALNVPDDLCNPAWPLPNMKESSERDFWGWMASYSPRARIYLGNQKINGEHATVLAYYMGETMPSFAVAVIYKHTLAHHPVYFEWTACVHDWKLKASGNCWRDYKCSKCEVERHEDSSG